MLLLKFIKLYRNRTAKIKPANLNGFDTASLTPTRSNNPAWADLLTTHVDNHYEPVPAELIVEGFHLYCGEIHAPIRAIQKRISEIDRELIAGLDGIQAAAPDLARRALDRSPLEVAHYVEME